MMTRTETQVIVDDIRTLHAHCVSVAEVARTLHLPERIIRHVIEHGVFPERQPQWTQQSINFEA